LVGSHQQPPQALVDRQVPQALVCQVPPLALVDRQARQALVRQFLQMTPNKTRRCWAGDSRLVT
jgi:hypothetical protein